MMKLLQKLNIIMCDAHKPQVCNKKTCMAYFGTKYAHMFSLCTVSFAPKEMVRKIKLIFAMFSALQTSGLDLHFLFLFTFGAKNHIYSCERKSVKTANEESAWTFALSRKAVGLC